jgi:predicted permease
MVEAFRAMLSDRRSHGLVARARFVVRACGEVLFEGIRARARRLAWAGRRMVDPSLGTPQMSAGVGGSHDPGGGSPLRGKSGGVGMMLRDMFDDVRQAVRGFGRAPVASATLILTLALGIGANTAVFSVLNGVLFAPLPYEDPGDLVTVGHALTNVEGAGLVGITGPDLLDYISGTRSAEAMGSVFTLETNLSDAEGAARVTMGWVTPDFFPTLGTTAAVGRMLDPADWTPRTQAQMEDPDFQPPPMPVMLSHGIWRSRFGSDPGIIGRNLVINGTGMNVVGVLPTGFRLYMPPEAGVPSQIDAFSYLPIPMTEGQRAGNGGVVVARIADGATQAQLVDELEAVNARLHDTWPEHGRFGTQVVSAPLLDGVVGPTRALLWVLFGAIGLVLLVAVANVANLLLVRASMRRREFAVRAALGVGRGRIVRQVLTESALLAVLGAGSGLALAWVGVDVLVSLAPVDIPRLDSVGIDVPVLLFTLAVTLSAAVLFGIVPALHSSRVDGRALVSSRGQVGSGRAGLRLRNALIVGELALSVVLVAGAGLLLRSFDQLGRVDPGFEPDGALAVEMALPFFTYRDLGVRQRFFRALRSRALEIPGVEVAGISPGLPLTDGGGTWLAPFAVAGANIADEGASRARYRAASEDYFAAIGAAIVDGRGFGPLDVADAGVAGSEVAVLVDETFARQSWPGQRAVGQTLDVMVAAYIGQGRQATGRVIGVVESMRHQSLAVADDPTIWVPFDEYAPLEGALVLRGPADAGAVAGAVREILGELDPGVPLFDVRPLTDDLAAATATNRYALILVGIFALTALLLAAVGLYGVVSTSVQQRTREIGVRLALGAEASGIGRMVLAQGARIVIAGVVLGVMVAAVASPVLESLLFQVAPLDPLTLALTVIVLSTVALFAGWVPAFRASRMDPVDALRAE